MTDKRKNKLLDEPVIVLNGLVTDKAQYSNEQIKEFLKKKKKNKEKKNKKYFFSQENTKNSWKY